MKTIKYLLMGVLMLGFGTTVSAQDDAVVAEIVKVLKSKPADLEDALKPYKKAMKKADVLTVIGRTCLELGDTLNARKYADEARKRDGKYAAAWVLSGDIAAEGTNGGAAAQNYIQAIHLDPKNPEGYYKYASVYATISPAEAVSKLEDLKVQRPDLAVDAKIAHVYYRGNLFKKAVEYFAQAPMDQLDETDYTEYAMSLYFIQKYQQSLDVVATALTKYPTAAVFNRLSLYNNTELENYEQALQAANVLFNTPDVKLSYMDYTYYGHALIGMKDYNKAVEAYKLALEQNIDSKEKRAGVISSLSDAYKKIDDYEAAAASYKEYLSLKDNPSALDQADLANIYVQHGNWYGTRMDQLKEQIKAEKNAAAKAELQAQNDADSIAKMSKLQQAENVYVEMSQNPDALEYATFWRARVNTMMDPDSKLGLARPHYEKLAELILAHEGERSKTDNNRLVEAYRYLGAYHWLTLNDKETGDIYWNKILEIDPENAMAKQALGVGKKKK